jgi:hypothetical protein
MNGWRSRLRLIAVFFVAARLHDLIMMGCENTPAMMAVYHGSAGAVDLFLLYLAQKWISGRLCDHIQASCIASVVINFVGYRLYMAYSSPDLYNHLITGLSCVQYLRLLLVYLGRHDADDYQYAVVPGASSARA